MIENTIIYVGMAFGPKIQLPQVKLPASPKALLRLIKENPNIKVRLLYHQLEKLGYTRKTLHCAMVRMKKQGRVKVKDGFASLPIP